MKLFRPFLMILSMLMLISLIFIQSCSPDDKTKASYNSKLRVSWEGMSFGNMTGCNIEPCTCPCSCFTSLNVTVSKFMIHRIDAESEPFDFFEGQSYTFDAKEYTNGNLFMAPDKTMTLDPGIYEILSITIDAIEASPDLYGDANMNQNLNAGLPAEADLNLAMGAYCTNNFNLQEGWQKAFTLGFSCDDSVQYRGGFYLTPTIYCTEPQCQF